MTLEEQQRYARNFNARRSSTIVHLQPDGTGWVPGQSGVDPADSTDITRTYPAVDVPGDPLMETLRGLALIHKQALEQIGKAMADRQKARVNREGVTPNNGQRFSRKRK